MQPVIFTWLVLSLLCGNLDALDVQIFKDIKFKGLIYELSGPPAACHELPEYARGEAGSVITDTCLMLYEGMKCDGNSFKLSRDMTEQLENLRRPINSFHICNQNAGGDIIKIDMFNHEQGLLVEYNDICGCQDLPSQVSTSARSLNNYGNCIAVYPEESCSGEKTEISGGTNGLSQDLSQLGHFVRSVSACGNRASCVKLDASIFKFEIFMDKPIEEKAGEVKMGQVTKFFNNGSATLTQEYEAVQTVRETTIVKLSKSITEMRGHRVETSRSVDVSVSASIPIPETTLAVNIGVNVGFSATKGFGSGESEGESESSEYTNVEEKQFTTKQTFVVPPCVEYQVSSTVKVVENYPIIYDVYSKVTGEANGKRITAQEVEGRVDGMAFVGYFDEYTAIFKATETIIANVGFETLITAEGNDIEGCVAVP